MDLFDRIHELDRILRRAHTPVSRAALQERLECSRATVGRIISEARACIGAPIEYDHRSGGYRYAASEDGPWELPGLWFNASELYTLLAAHHLLANAQPGLLEGELTPPRWMSPRPASTSPGTPNRKGASRTGTTFSKFRIPTRANWSATSSGTARRSS